MFWIGEGDISFEFLKELILNGTIYTTIADNPGKGIPKYT
jgi:hypothetical protein